jgi:hypothetical protein
MRAIGKTDCKYGFYRYYTEDADIFCKEAVFMQDFTDNYDEVVPLDDYHLSYFNMDDLQLRTYFTWRTKVRQGNVENTSLPYAFHYLCELINDVGVISAADGINKMINFWSSFRNHTDRLDGYCREWIRDYFVLHHAELADSFESISCRFPVPYRHVDMALVKRAISCTWDNLKAIELSSSHKITKGHFYKSKNPKLIEECVCYVVNSLAKLFNANGVDFRKMFCEKRQENIPLLFKNALHKARPLPPFVVRIDAIETIKHTARAWYSEQILFDVYKSAVAYIMKCIELNMRKVFGHRNGLQTPSISQAKNSFLHSEPDTFPYRMHRSLKKLKSWKSKAYDIIISPAFAQTIDRAISEYLRMAHIVIKDGESTAAQPVTVDMSKLAQIEKDHEETAQKLILPEYIQKEERIWEQTPPNAGCPCSPQPKSLFSAAASRQQGTIQTEKTTGMSGMDGLAKMLSREELAFVSTLLAGGQAPPNSELMIESINNKALSTIDDNVIDCIDGIVSISDFYFCDLKTAAGGQRQ